MKKALKIIIKKKNDDMAKTEKTRPPPKHFEKQLMFNLFKYYLFFNYNVI